MLTSEERTTIVNSNKWFKKAIVILAVIIGSIAALVILIDPYYHWHKPIAGLDYQGFNVLYSNNGMLKNFDYDALIVGTSITLGFSEEEASDLFDERFIRTSFPGEGFRIIGQQIQTGLDHQSELKHVIYAVDEQFFITSPDYEGQPDSSYPKYLYDDNPFNDAAYPFNIGTWKEAMIPTMVSSIRQSMTAHAAENDDAARIDQYFENNEALDNYNREEKNNDPVDPNETAQFFSDLEANLNQNVIPMIAAHPDVRFDLFFPPYSILYWDDKNQAGTARLNRRIDMEEKAIEMLLQYDNVRLFSFHDNYNLITDLSQYSDAVHYKPEVCSRILKWIHDGDYELTEDNYKNYIADLRDFLDNYDYDALFE